MKIGKIGVISLIAIGILIAAVLGYSESGTQKTANPDGFSWNKYDEGLKIAAQNKKPLMVDFYTDWCGYCKKLDKTTYADPTVAKYVKEHFVAVKINAESKESINLPTGKTNGAAIARSFGVTGYPAIWFLEPDGKKINFYPGYAPPDKFIHVLRYIGDGHYKKQSWKDYSANLSSN